jgi:hypothetical protein
MKKLINISKRMLSILYIIPILVLSEIFLSSCSEDEIAVKQNYPFEVFILPVPKDIANNETVEIRIKISPVGNFIENKYFLRYFQSDGKGELRYFNDLPYQPNDSYILSQKDFILHFNI